MIIKDIKIRSKRKMKKETNHKIDVIIPAYKAHDTILRTLSSIMAQTILDVLLLQLLMIVVLMVHIKNLNLI
jgi:cellulose synthase/poly-beta-1,6-N-acetylglucosamine synthase-like glycosyltransferase